MLSPRNVRYAVMLRVSAGWDRVPGWHTARLLGLAVLACALSLSSCLEDATGPALQRGGWQKLDSGTDENLHGIWGFESGEAFAVGDDGTIVHFNGKSWRKMTSGTTADLVGIWGIAPDNMIATGAGGTILHYDGALWSPMTSGTTMPIGAIWGLSIYPDPRQDPFWAYAVGGGPPGTILYYDGHTWRPIDTGGTDELTDIIGWLPYAYDTSAFLPRLMAVGANGSARFFDGQDWMGSDTGIGENLVGVWGDSPDNVYAVGAGGMLIQNTEPLAEPAPSMTWSKVAQIAGGGLSDIAARHFNDLFLVGGGGQVVNFDRLSVSDMRTPTREALHSIWSGERTVLAIGDAGTILRYDRKPHVPVCPINVNVNATRGLTPVITWWPSCPVSKLIIEDDWGNPHWFIEAEGNLIYPGVEFGTIPPNAVERIPVRYGLYEGDLYRVTLIRRDGHKEVTVGTWNLVPASLTGGGDVVLSRTAGAGPQAGPDIEARYFYFQEVQLAGTGANIYTFGRVAAVVDGDWRAIGDPQARAQALNVRPVTIEYLTRDRDTGEVQLHVRHNVLVKDLTDDVTVMWDVWNGE